MVLTTGNHLMVAHHEAPRPHPEERPLGRVSKDGAVEPEICSRDSFFVQVWRKEAYLSPSAARKVGLSQDDGAETQSGLRADPGAVPGASTLAA
jgi:hypothetical protein